MTNFERVYTYPNGKPFTTIQVDKAGLATVSEAHLHLAMLSAGFREQQ